jgi:translocation and assembly module TamB
MMPTVLRRTLLLTAILAAALVLAAGSSRWWLPAGVFLYLQWQGITVEAWSATATGSWRIENLSGGGDGDAASWRIDSLEILRPVAWWRETRAGATTGRPVLSAVGGHINLAAGGPAPATTEPFPGAAAVHALLLRLQQPLQRWVPRAELRGLSIATAHATLNLESLTWADGALAIRLLADTPPLQLDFSGPLDGPWLARIQSPLHPVPMSLQVRPEYVSGDLTLHWSAVWEWLASEGLFGFAASGLLPDQGASSLDVLPFAGAAFGLPELRITGGHWRMQWQDAQWTASGDLHGIWIDAQIELPLRLQVGLHGDATAINVDRLDIEAPWIHAGLSRPVRYDWHSHSFDQPFTFLARADLAATGMPGLSGAVELLVSTHELQPVAPDTVACELTARDLHWAGWHLAALEASGSLSRAGLSVDNLRWQLSSPQPASGQATASFAFGGDGISGDVSANGDWQGWTFAGSGTGNWHDQRLHIALAHAEASHPEHLPPSQLVQPVRIDYDHASAAWQVDDLAIAGANDLRLHGMAAGAGPVPHTFELTANALPAGRLAAVFGLDAGAGLFLDSLHAAWRQDDAGASWQLAAAGSWQGEPLPDDQPVNFTITATGSPERSDITAFSLTGRSTPFFSGSGFLPLTLAWDADGPAWRLDPAAPLELHLDMAARPTLLRLLHEWSGLDITGPAATADLTGSIQHPRGTLRLAAARIASAADVPGAHAWQLDDLVLAFDLSPEAIRLSEGHASYAGLPLHLSGSLPAAPQQWRSWLTGQAWPDWRQASARLEIPQLPLAALAHLLPAAVAPVGEASANLVVEPGPRLHGTLAIRGGATRPLANGIALRAIDADIDSVDTTLTIRQASALVERSPVRLTGTIELAGASLPAWDLRLSGSNLPLARSDDFILRGSPELRLLRPAGPGPARIEGTVRLGDSLLLRDIRHLLRPGAATPESRPPFFAVETPALRDWQLDLRFSGEGFLRVQTPFFQGRLSADLRLGGTLGDPYATGRLEVDSGRVLFPFANLNIDSGSVRLTQANPYEPILDLQANARSMDYDLRLELTGNAADPVIRFQSSPPLSQDAILLLLSAGILPDRGAPGAELVGQRLALYVGRNLATDLFGGSAGAWTENLSIQSGGRISDSGRETFRIEYRLREDLSLYAENDVYDETSGGVRWRFFSR